LTSTDRTLAAMNLTALSCSFPFAAQRLPA
jgi:hypothetical protein